MILDLPTVIQWTAACSGVTGSVLLSIHKPWSYFGWGFFIMASILWVFVGLSTGIYSLVASSVLYAIIETYGLHKSLKHLKRNKK